MVKITSYSPGATKAPPSERPSQVITVAPAAAGPLVIVRRTVPDSMFRYSARAVTGRFIGDVVVNVIVWVAGMPLSGLKTGGEISGVVTVGAVPYNNTMLAKI